jgi:sporulation integral membrane protein YtvI
MNNMYRLDTKKVLRAAIYTVLVLLFAYAAYRASYYFVPLIIAFAISSIIEPIIRAIIRRTNMPRKTAAPIVLLLFIIPLAIIATLVVLRLITEIKSFAMVLPKNIISFYESIESLIAKSTEFYHWLPSEISSNLDNVILNLSNSIIRVLNSIVEGTVSTVISLPQALVSIIITILATYFMASDRDKIYNFFRAQFPDKLTDKALSIKNDIFSALFGYLRAQLILISITFSELFIGFTIIGVRYSLLLAFITSIVDALPVLGTGTILIPWSVFNFITGNFRVGVSLLIIYVIILIVRQLIEPKILSRQIGVYPLVTLTAIYAGLRVFGVLGLILGPVIVLVVKNVVKGALKGKPLKDIFNKIE